MENALIYVVIALIVIVVALLVVVAISRNNARKQKALLDKVNNEVGAPLSMMQESVNLMLKDPEVKQSPDAFLKTFSLYLNKANNQLDSICNNNPAHSAAPAPEAEAPKQEEKVEPVLMPGAPEDAHEYHNPDVDRFDISPVSDLKDATILIVEDDFELRTYVASELADYVINVLEADNGQQAADILAQNHVDIVVSDVMMPVMDGFSLCRHIKTTISISHIPVILLTARSDADSRVLGYKNGADDYITKPFDILNLIESIKRLFYGRELARKRILAEASTKPKEVTFSSADEHFLDIFDDFIKSNISDADLDTKRLINYMGMSRTVLFNKVKQLTGLSLQGYTNKVRMEHVKKLLSTTDLSISEVARLSGFSSPRYLSTAFKNYSGLTPSEFKKYSQK